MYNLEIFWIPYSGTSARSVWHSLFQHSVPHRKHRDATCDRCVGEIEDREFPDGDEVDHVSEAEAVDDISECAAGDEGKGDDDDWMMEIYFLVLVFAVQVVGSGNDENQNERDDDDGRKWNAQRDAGVFENMEDGGGRLHLLVHYPIFRELVESKCRESNERADNK